MPYTTRFFCDGRRCNAPGLLRAAIGSDNVDVKALGGYVMAPGSLHYSGTTYTATSPLSHIVIESARDWKSKSPDEHREYFLTKQRKLVDEQWVAAQVLPTGTRKVVRGFQELSLARGGGTFTASLAEVAIQAGVEISTVQRHRGKLVAGGWLVMVWESNGGGKASTYRLKVPKPVVPVTCAVGNPHGLGGYRGCHNLLHPLLGAESFDMVLLPWAENPPWAKIRPRISTENRPKKKLLL